MSREWAPGDVALVRNEWNVWNVAICTLREGRPGWWWRYGVADSWSPIANPDARPLVVIDPEDREQVERLRDVIAHAKRDFAELFGPSVESVQDALRSLVADPKPEEPTGLGAVVEDAGEEFVHFGNGCWIKTVPNANLRQKAWPDFTAAVRVIHKGVPDA